MAGHFSELGRFIWWSACWLFTSWARSHFIFFYCFPAYQFATVLFLEWQAALPDAIRSHFSILTVAVTNWQQEFFGYFDHRVTNGYTEALNGVVKVVNRMGRGYSFEAIRAKMLFTNSLHKERRPKYGEVRSHVVLQVPVEHRAEDGEISLGVDMQAFAAFWRDRLDEVDFPCRLEAESTYDAEIIRGLEIANSTPYDE